MSDLISRAELFNRLATVKDMGEAYAVIQGMPTIVERKTGEWIFKEDFRIVDGYDWKCNQCGSWQRYTSNYCPNCGAVMDLRL